MSRFKVGDRIVVSKPDPSNDFQCRGVSCQGMTGEVFSTFDDQSGADVKLDSGERWSFLDHELELVVAHIRNPTLLDQFAMAALTGLIALPGDIPGMKTIADAQKAYAELAFGYARAMMVEREKGELAATVSAAMKRHIATIGGQ